MTKTTLLLLMLSSAQGAPQETVTLQRNAEDQVARQFDAIRASAKLPKLGRIMPTTEQVQLVCSAAVSGKEVHEPMFGGLTTYVTSDPTILDERLHDAAISPYGPELKHGTRYSIVVLFDRSSTADHPTYMVGVLRRSSAFFEFLDTLTFDHPIEDRRDWKEQVVPECQNLKP